jgi:DNA sulfur modification protein DndD
LLEARARAAAALRDVNAAIQAAEVPAPQLEQKRVRISELNGRIRQLSEEQGAKENLIASRKVDLEQRRKELGRLTGQLDQSARPARLAKRAEEVASMLDELSADAWPVQAQSIASAMTLAVKEIAHRSDYLSRVEITDDGQVMLLTPDGRNLRELDLSAGEKQIFTQALFWAIAHVSGRVFPLVIDTPLGRLDQEHRLNVLRHLVRREGQVILISTNTEVGGPYLDAIRSRVIKACRIENSTDGDIGSSWPVDGYFPGEGI